MKQILIAVAISLCAGVLFAEEKTVWKKGEPLPPLHIPMPWPKLEKVEIIGRAEPKKNNFMYEYAVYSSTANIFPVYRFAIDIRIDPKEHPFSSQDITAQHTGTKHTKEVLKGRRVEILEVSSPNKWHSAILAKPRGANLPGTWVAGWDGAGWNETSDLLLKPGETASDFALQTKEPIGIREYIVDAIPVPDFDKGLLMVPFERSDFYLKSPDFIAEINKGVEVLGETIAPVAPPEPFTASSWIARMNADAVEARKLGWIKTDKNLAEIRKLIDGLTVNDPDKLKTAVEKIAAYVLSEKGKKNLTDEADALVRLNAEYFLRRTLQEEKKRE